MSTVGSPQVYLSPVSDPIRNVAQVKYTEEHDTHYYKSLFNARYEYAIHGSMESLKISKGFFSSAYTNIAKGDPGQCIIDLVKAVFQAVIVVVLVQPVVGSFIPNVMIKIQIIFGLIGDVFAEAEEKHKKLVEESKKANNQPPNSSTSTTTSQATEPTTSVSSSNEPKNPIKPSSIKTHNFKVATEDPVENSKNYCIYATATVVALMVIGIVVLPKLCSNTNISPSVDGAGLVPDGTPACWIWKGFIGAFVGSVSSPSPALKTPSEPQPSPAPASKTPASNISASTPASKIQESNTRGKRPMGFLEKYWQELRNGGGGSVFL